MARILHIFPENRYERFEGSWVELLVQLGDEPLVFSYERAVYAGGHQNIDAIGKIRYERACDYIGSQMWRKAYADIILHQNTMLEELSL